MKTEYLIQCSHCGIFYDKIFIENTNCPSCKRPNWVKKKEFLPECPKGKYNCRGELNKLCGNISRWADGKGFKTNWFLVPEKLMLIVSELGEAMEAYRQIPLWARKNLADSERGGLSKLYELAVKGEKKHLSVVPPVRNFGEELADTAIRLFALSSKLGYDLEKEIERKMAINESRPFRHGKEC